MIDGRASTAEIAHDTAVLGISGRNGAGIITILDGGVIHIGLAEDARRLPVVVAIGPIRSGSAGDRAAVMGPVDAHAGIGSQIGNDTRYVTSGIGYRAAVGDGIRIRGYARITDRSRRHARDAANVRTSRDVARIGGCRNGRIGLTGDAADVIACRIDARRVGYGAAKAGRGTEVAANTADIRAAAGRRYGADTPVHRGTVGTFVGAAVFMEIDRDGVTRRNGKAGGPRKNAAEIIAGVLIQLGSGALEYPQAVPIRAARLTFTGDRPAHGNGARRFDGKGKTVVIVIRRVSGALPVAAEVIRLDRRTGIAEGRHAVGPRDRGFVVAARAAPVLSVFDHDGLSRRDLLRKGARLGARFLQFLTAVHEDIQPVVIRFGGDRPGKGQSASDRYVESNGVYTVIDALDPAFPSNGARRAADQRAAGQMPDDAARIGACAVIGIALAATRRAHRAAIRGGTRDIGGALRVADDAAHDVARHDVAAITATDNGNGLTRVADDTAAVTDGSDVTVILALSDDGARAVAAGDGSDDTARTPGGVRSIVAGIVRARGFDLAVIFTKSIFCQTFVASHDAARHRGSGDIAVVLRAGDRAVTRVIADDAAHTPAGTADSAKDGAHTYGHDFRRVDTIGAVVTAVFIEFDGDGTLLRGRKSIGRPIGIIRAGGGHFIRARILDLEVIISALGRDSVTEDEIAVRTGIGSLEGPLGKAVTHVPTAIDPCAVIDLSRIDGGRRLAGDAADVGTAGDRADIGQIAAEVCCGLAHDAARIVAARDFARIGAVRDRRGRVSGDAARIVLAAADVAIIE